MSFFLYILDINPLSDIWFSNIFSHSIGYLFILLIVSFAASRILHTYRLSLLSMPSTPPQLSSYVYLCQLEPGFLLQQLQSKQYPTGTSWALSVSERLCSLTGPSPSELNYSNTQFQSEEELPTFHMFHSSRGPLGYLVTSYYQFLIHKMSTNSYTQIHIHTNKNSITEYSRMKGNHYCQRRMSTSHRVARSIKRTEKMTKQARRLACHCSIGAKTRQQDTYQNKTVYYSQHSKQ